MASVPEGWVPQHETTFGTHVGPFYFASTGGAAECGFIADERHGNRRGVVHGGMLATAFDVALGVAGREASGAHQHATIQLNVQFVGGMKIDEFAVIRCEVTRITRSLVFMRGVMRVGDRVIATADGIWKTLQSRLEP